MLWRSIFLDRSKFDFLFFGFLPQAILPFFRKRRGEKIISDVFYSLYDTVIEDRKVFGKKSLIARVCKELDRQTLSKSDVVITDTLAHSRYFCDSFNCALEKFHRIWISAGEEYSERKLGQLSIEDDNVCNVLFVGSFIPLQGVEVILSAAALLARENFSFTFVGNGQTFIESRRSAKNFELKNVCFLGARSSEEILNLAEDSHILLGIFGTSDKAQRVIPHKVFEALAIGKPVITERSPAVCELLEEKRDVILVNPGDAMDLVDKLRWVKQNYLRALEIGRQGQITFHNRAHPKIVAEELRNIISG